MRVTQKLLTDKGACQEGVEAFIKAFPKGFDSANWTLEKQLEVLHDESLRRYFGWAYFNGIVPLWSMYGANLYGANLSSANLNSANLSSAHLTTAHQTGAILRSANIRSDNLFCAFLFSAYLLCANLSCAYLISAYLRSAYLSSANLYGADLRSAYHKYTKFPEGFDIKAAGGWLVE